MAILGESHSASNSSPHKIATAACLLLVVVGFVLRLAPLGRYVTPDEPNWVYRSVSFRDAVAASDWTAIPPTGHPGVTTMWLGTAGITVHQLLSPGESDSHLDWIRNLAWLDPESGEAFRHLAFFLPGARVAVAIVTSLGLAVLFLLLSHLFDRDVAFLTVGLLVFDPFFTGHSGLLHTDALLSTFGLLTLASALNGLQNPRRAGWWLLAGTFGGLALLTKSPALIFVGFVPLLLALRCVELGVRGTLKKEDCLRAIVDGLLFVVSLAIAFSAPHPGVWTNPVGIFQRSFSLAGRHVTSVQHPVFFAGKTVLDPGVAFYPVVFLFRISPLVLLGLVFGLARLSLLPSDRRSVFLILLLFVVVFSLGMSLSTKKHDRYLLPIFPPLALGAALGLVALLDHYRYKAADLFRSLVSKAVGGPIYQIGLIMIVILQATVALAWAAYPLTYYNPLLGGLATASWMVPTGWGEGWGAAARQLNQLPEADKLSVAASSVPSFASVFRGRTLPLEDEEIPLANYVVTDHLDDDRKGLEAWASLGVPSRRRPTTIYENTAPLQEAKWLDAYADPGDLILLDADTPLCRRYSGQAELLCAASLPDEAALADWLAEHVPRHGAVWLVESPGASPVTAENLRHQLEVAAAPLRSTVVASSRVTKFVPRSAPKRTEPAVYRASFGGQIALVDGAIPESVKWPQPLNVTLRWRALSDLRTDYQAVVALRSDNGHTWASDETLVRNGANFPTSAWRAGEWTDMPHHLQLPPGIPPDRYSLEVSLYDRATGARLGGAGPEGAFLGTRVRVGDVVITSPGESPGANAFDIDQRLDVVAETLRLIGISSVPKQVVSGDSLSFELFWQAEEAPGDDYRVRLRLDGAQPGLESTVALSPYPTSRWEAGDRFQAHYDLHISPSISPGDWDVMLNVLDEGGHPLWEQDRGLATLQVVGRERRFTLPTNIPHKTGITFGERIHLRGYSIDETRVSPGESILLTLYWEAGGPTDRDYTLFVHLIGSDGGLVGQVDRIPGNGTAPTSSWAEGQVIVDEVALPTAPGTVAGLYRIAIGFYDAAYGERLSVTDGSGNVLPQDRLILPKQIGVAK